MKIAMLTNNYRPFVGGVPVSVERQAQELTRLGHQVTVVAPMYGDDEEERSRVLEQDERSPCWNRMSGRRSGWSVTVHRK